MIDFIEKNSAAIFTVLGFIIGALVSFIGNWLLKKKELVLRLREKVLDKRIQAHENIIQLSISIRTMNILGFENKQGELSRMPYMFSSRKHFDEWYMLYNELTATSTTWLSTELTRELNLFQDYIVNLYEKIKLMTDSNITVLGTIVRQDFIDFSSSLEKFSFKLFSSRSLPQVTLLLQCQA
jgi:hypothetical protein